MTPIDAMAAPPERGEFTGTLIYTVGEYNMIQYSLATAAFAMLAGFLYAISTRNEVSPRYRGASIASALVHAVAFLAYVALSINWRTSYTLRDGLYVPAGTSAFDGGLRYADWSVTVPLLAVELLAVCAITGKRMFTLRALAISSAFLMIVTGFLGAQVFDDGTSVLWLTVWAAISTVFFLVLYAVLGKAVLDSVKELPPETSTTLKRAAITLFSVFGAYPLIYLIQQSVGEDSNLVAWAMVTQLGLCAADIIAKVGFGAMIHKVAKMRTAENVRSGTEPHPEGVWISSVKQADAWPPVAAALTGHSAHPEPVQVSDGNGHGVR